MRSIVKYQNRVLGLLALLSIITYVDRICIAVAGPRMQDDLHISPEAWGWVTGIFALSYGAFSIPVGALGDRFGPRRVLTWIVLWWSAFTTLTGPAPNYYLLLLTRFCFGIGEAGAYPNASAVIVRWIPASRVARAWGIVWLASQFPARYRPWWWCRFRRTMDGGRRSMCLGCLGSSGAASGIGGFGILPEKNRA